MTSIGSWIDTELEAARRRDREDVRAEQLRDRFHLPVGRDGRPKAYLAGQSLGAQPRAARAAAVCAVAMSIHWACDQRPGQDSNLRPAA